jgi:hypothetical protein
MVSIAKPEMNAAAGETSRRKTQKTNSAVEIVAMKLGIRMAHTSTSPRSQPTVAIDQ